MKTLLKAHASFGLGIVINVDVPCSTNFPVSFSSGLGSNDMLDSGLGSEVGDFLGEGDFRAHTKYIVRTRIPFRLLSALFWVRRIGCIEV